NDNVVRFYQFLPLYDVIHLGNVLRQGYTPTSGEMTWALIDGCFVVADVLSLAAIQPGGAAAVETIRSEVKGALGQGARYEMRGLSETGQSTGEALLRQQAKNGIELAASDGATAVSTRLARWWAVRSAGGIYQVLRGLPEAVSQFSISQVAEMAGPFCAKA